MAHSLMIVVLLVYLPHLCLFYQNFGDVLSRIISITIPILHFLSWLTKGNRPESKIIKNIEYIQYLQ